MLFIYLIVTYLTKMENVSKIKAFFIMLLTLTDQPLTYKVKISQCNDMIINVPYNECFPIYGDCVFGSVLIFQKPHSSKYQVNLYSNINCDDNGVIPTFIPYKESGLKITDPLTFYLMFLIIITILLVMIL
ncbi:hypothetical protein ACTFIY_010926 [Dictyostelium cf. discoideum]